MDWMRIREALRIWFAMLSHVKGTNVRESQPSVPGFRDANVFVQIPPARRHGIESIEE